MDPIRPNIFPAPSNATPGASGGADAARLAAQKAFFAAAMGQAAAPAAAATRTTFFAPAAAPIPRPEIRPDPSAEAPAKILRPGSLLDIRV